MQAYSCGATVLAVAEVEDKGVAKTVVILDRTVLHPQVGILYGNCQRSLEMLRGSGRTRQKIPNLVQGDTRARPATQGGGQLK